MAYGGYLITIMLMALYEKNVTVWMNAADAMLGVGLPVLLFSLVAYSNMYFNLALSLAVLFQIGYALVRSWLFAPTLALISSQMLQFYKQLSVGKSLLSISAAQMQWVIRIWNDYQAGIWVALTISAMFLGLLLFNRVSPIPFPVKMIRFPYPIVYLFIIALGLSLLHQHNLLGINLLIALSFMYLLQGTGVLSFFWSDFFKKAKLLRTLLVMAIILNYPLLVLIAFIGVLDVWFDFRKYNRLEETSESNPD